MPPLLWARRAFVNITFNLPILKMFLLIDSQNTKEGKKAWTASHFYDDQSVVARGSTVIFAEPFNFIIPLLEVDRRQPLPSFLFPFPSRLPPLIFSTPLISTIP